jgi:hypothetical protein
MKLSSLLLTGSVAANAALLALLLRGSFVGGSERPISATPALTAPAAAAAPSETTPDPGTWSNLAGDDLTAQRERMRAAGFPEPVVRAILAARISEKFAAQRRALSPNQGDVEFWKVPTPDPAKQAALRALNLEQQKELKDLLGVNPRLEDPAYLATLRRQFGDLPDEKIALLSQLQESYNEKRNAIYGNGVTLPEDRQKAADLEKAMQAEFASVLTPAEYEAYLLRSSNTASQLRSELTAFNPTEEEYKTIFRLQKPFDDQYRNLVGPLSQEQQQARAAAQKQVQDDIKAALGDARYAEYQRGKDSSYRLTTQLVARLELPPETANQVYAVQQDIQQRAAVIRQDRALNPADRTAQLATLASEAETRISGSLGAQGFAAYRDNNTTSSWLRNLVPQPARGQPAASGALMLR